MKEPRFSVIVLCYRHFEYLPAAIDSILSQDYPNIELIISDDGSPNFPRQDVEAYIAAHKGGNITNVIIHQEEANCGTVRHLNHAFPLCTGDYVTLLAGDDALYSSHVLSAYAEGFSLAPRDCYVEMAHTGMYDETLEVFEAYYMTPDVQAALEKAETDTTDLLKVLIAKGACLPTTSTCFRGEFFEKFGKFDERYMLVEDYPMHVRLASEGWHIHYENFIAVKHRSGGISHGQKNTLPRSKVLYFTDNQHMIEDITLKNLSVLDPAVRDVVARKKKRERDWNMFLLARSRKAPLEMLTLAARHPAYSCSVVLNRASNVARKLQKPLLCLWLVLWFFAPVIAGMFETLTACSAYVTLPLLFAFARCVLAFWLLCVLVMGLQWLLWRIQRFPDDTLRVG